MNKNKAFILTFSVFCMILLMGYKFYDSKANIMGIPVISGSQADMIADTRTRGEIPVSLFFDGVKIPADSTKNNYYISQSVDCSYWQGAVTADLPVDIRIIRPDKNKLQTIKSNSPLNLILYTDDVYCVKTMTVSGLPVISVDGEYTENENTFGTVTVLDNKSGGRKNVISARTYNCYSHIRGGTSKEFPKNSYKLNLTDKNGKSKGASLLGMRDDNDWILNAMYTDDSKMREKIGYDLWDSLNGKHSHGMEYCEVIMDGEYKGIYCLQEPVDNKTFGYGKNAVILMSVKGWREKLTQMYLYGEDVHNRIYAEGGLNGEMEINGFQSEKIHDIVEFMKFVSTDRCAGADRNFVRDKESFVNHSLLINMICAEDNAYKNQKMCAVKKEGVYTVYKTPWDLDLSMENPFSYTDEKTVANPVTDEIITDLLYTASGGDNGALREKYIRARKAFYNSDYIHAVADGYYNQLSDAGAYSRDSEKWGSSGGQSRERATEHIKRFFDYRFRILDEYYGTGQE